MIERIKPELIWIAVSRSAVGAETERIDFRLVQCTVAIVWVRVTEHQAEVDSLLFHANCGSN